MIICHCQTITDHDIHAAIDWMRASDPCTLITPGKVYRALGKAADCGGCLPLFLSIMRKNENLTILAGIANLRSPVYSHPESDTQLNEELRHERRSKGH
ncbi:MAG: (2Fe-2S)-binding protein [Rhodobacteraceae bacterium]|nr:(2Fe-2S)-binding protein [Paracoccaceae bacterium]